MSALLFVSGKVAGTMIINFVDLFIIYFFISISELKNVIIIRSITFAKYTNILQ